MDRELTRLKHDQLEAFAHSLGASETCLIPSKEIFIDEQLSEKCIDPGCPNYGLSFSCPPYVEGPDHFLQLIDNHPHAIVIRLIVPSESLLSWERVEIGRVLHELVARLEMEAVKLGWTRAKAFAGDSCKKLFCNDHLSCNRIADNGPCRHPDLARPSMSGFGVDVYRMIQSCGWVTNLDYGQEKDPADQLSWVAGLVLLG